MSITNSTLSGNRAGESGGTICSSGELNISNSTIINNTADFDGDDEGDGGGINCRGGTVTLKNTIVAENADNSPQGNAYPDISDISGNITGNAYNLIADMTGAGGGTVGTGSDIVNPSPGLGGLLDNGGPTQTHALLTSSPAINATADCTDLDSNPVITD